MDTASISPLHELARRYGVETAYYDLAGKQQVASSEALVAVLRAMGAPIATLEDIPAAIREHEQAIWRTPLQPVAVAWDASALRLAVRLPATTPDVSLAGHLRLESGEPIELTWPGTDLTATDSADVEGTQYVVKQLPLPAGLPYGFHRLTLEIPHRTAETWIIVAPGQACVPTGGRDWGVFLPLYAIHHDKSWGGGNFSDLESLMTWAGGLGGKLVGTLPLLATFLDEPFDPSPYSPVSRLFWNEFYIDVDRAPELKSCPSAQAILASPQFQAEIDSLRRSPYVDYRRQMALKRRVLEELCHGCFAGPSSRLDDLRRFADANRLVDDYARFRAATEQQQLPWPQWAQPQRDGTINQGDYGEEVRRYHLYVQFLANEQVRRLSEKGRAAGVGLYLDLPLGAHPSGYDVWRNREIFALDCSGGAPPDAFFIKGQNWGFPPLHPERIRLQGYQYFAACLRHLLTCASVLRIDHVMQFHRLFWIPRGMEAKQGVYVNYHPEEFYAVLAIESQRHKALIVGEDLGTVPPEVRPAMARHGLQRMYVLQFQVSPDPARALPDIPADTVASLNTHDIPTFAAFWQEIDLLDRQALGLLDDRGFRLETERRRAMKQSLAGFFSHADWASDIAALPDIRRSTLTFLAASQARTVLINLEDLWLETQQQNTPGIWMERRNWCRKTRYSLDGFRQLPEVVDNLREIDRRQKEGSGGTKTNIS